MPDIGDKPNQYLEIRQEYDALHRYPEDIQRSLQCVESSYTRAHPDSGFIIYDVFNYLDHQPPGYPHAWPVAEVGDPTI